MRTIATCANKDCGITFWSLGKHHRFCCQLCGEHERLREQRAATAAREAQRRVNRIARNEAARREREGEIFALLKKHLPGRSRAEVMAAQRFRPLKAGEMAHAHADGRVHGFPTTEM